MGRAEQKNINQLAICRAAQIIMSGAYFVPPYSVVVGVLNNEGYRTSRNNEWTNKRLFRMLQRNGFGGLWGLRKVAKKRAFSDTVRGLTMPPLEPLKKLPLSRSNPCFNSFSKVG